MTTESTSRPRVLLLTNLSKPINTPALSSPAETESSAAWKHKGAVLDCTSNTARVIKEIKASVMSLRLVTVRIAALGPDIFFFFKGFAVELLCVFTLIPGYDQKKTHHHITLNPAFTIRDKPLSQL